MSYPFSELPTLKDFIEVAQKQIPPAQHITSQLSLVGPRGPTPVRYLLRKGGKVILPETMELADRLTPSTISTWCRRLQVDPRLFGLVLDGLPQGPRKVGVSFRFQ